MHTYVTFFMYRLPKWLFSAWWKEEFKSGPHAHCESRQCDNTARCPITAYWDSSPSLGLRSWKICIRNFWQNELKIISTIDIIFNSFIFSLADPCSLRWVLTAPFSSIWYINTIIFIRFFCSITIKYSLYHSWIVSLSVSEVINRIWSVLPKMPWFCSPKI